MEKTIIDHGLRAWKANVITRAILFSAVISGIVILGFYFHFKMELEAGVIVPRCISIVDTVQIITTAHNHIAKK